MSYNNITQILPKKEEEFKNFYARITDKERRFYGAKGLKVKHIDLLKRLIIFSKKNNNKFIVHNSYLMQFLMVSSRTTVYNYLKILEQANMIRLDISHMFIKGKVRKIRVFSVNFEEIISESICSNSVQENLNKENSKASESELQENQQTNITSKIKKLYHIFKTKTNELGYKISQYHLEIECLRFHEFYQKNGFDKWITPNGKRLTFRAVSSWILNDRWGVFFEERKEQYRLKKEEQKRKIQDKQDELFIKYGDINKYHSSIVLETWKNKIEISDEEILYKLQSRFSNDGRLQEYLERYA